MRDATGAHPSDDALELYALDRLPEKDFEQLEEHLLACEDCRNRLQDTDVFLTAMREALAGREVRERAEAERKREKPVFSLWPPSRAVWAGALAVAALLVAFVPSWQVGGPVREVELQAWRGPAAAIESRAPSGSALSLRADIAGLPEAPAFRVEVAGETGDVISTREVKRAGSELVVAMDEGLKPGRYWVRVYSLGDADRPLREFGLVVGGQ